MRVADRTLLAVVLIASASAAHGEARHRVDVPAGSLGTGLAVLGRQTGISVGLSDTALAASRVKAVSGSYTAFEALQRLLRGTGATFVNVGPGAWRVVRARPQARPRPAPRRVRSPSVPRPSRPAARPRAMDDPVPEEIVVTASKRATILPRFPGSAFVLGMDDFPPDAAGQGTEAIASRLPGVTSTHLGSGRNKLFVRGIADSSFNGPTQATVGQYLGETRLNYNAPDPDLRLYDVAGVEVLQGPQGTLHGAGSLGGVLRVIPVAPNLHRPAASLSASGALTAGGEASHDLAGTLNLPLAEDRLGLRLVAYRVEDGGYIDDRLRGLSDVNRVETVGGRLALRAAPASHWTVDLGAALQSIRGDDSQYSERGAAGLSKASAIAQPFDNRYGLAQFVVRREWGDLSLTSATGLAEQRLDETYDATQAGGVPTRFRQKSRVSLLSSENRLARNGADGSGWVIGTSLVRNRFRLNRAFEMLEMPMFRTIGGVENRVDEATLFGEATFALREAVHITGGARVTHARLSGAALDAPTALAARTARMDARRDETNLLPSLAVAFEPRRDLTLFLRYQEGFRPGGIVPRGESVDRYRRDDVAAWEAGLRYGTPGRDAFDAALSIAFTRWNDVQADLIDGIGLPVTTNIGDGRILSLDATMGWRPLPGLSLEAAAVVTDSQLTNPAPSTIIVTRSDLPNVARLNARLGADYRLGSDRFDLRLSGWARYVGKSRLGVGPILGAVQGDYLDTAVSVRAERGRYALYLSLTNLLDSVGNRFALGSPFTLAAGDQITPLRPRTIRIGFEAGF